MSLFKSKKFLMAIAGVVAVVVSHLFNIGEDAIMKVLVVVIGYILGQGIADFGKEAVKEDNKKK